MSENPQPVHENIALDIFQVVEGAFIALMLVCITFFLLNYFNILHLSTLSPIFSSFPHINSSVSTQQNQTSIPFPTTAASPVPQSTAQIMSCTVAKAGNSIVKRLNTVNNVVIGVYEGTISSLSTQTNSVSFQLTSLTHDETLSIVTQISIPIFDQTHENPSSLSQLHNGAQVIINFNCFLNENRKFTVTSIGIENT